MAEHIKHGENAGYSQGCRQDCCREAHNAKMREWKRHHALHGLMMSPSIGCTRRIRALMVMGWSSTDIAQASGEIGFNQVKELSIGRHPQVQSATVQAVRRVYDALSMKPPPQGPKHTRGRNMAIRKGWSPPLAWDEEAIDDPQARPRGVATRQPPPPRSGRQRRDPVLSATG